MDGDSRDDLIIASPYANYTGAQSGIVGVLLSKKKEYNAIIDVNNLDWLVNGSMVILMSLSLT